MLVVVVVVVCFDLFFRPSQLRSKDRAGVGAMQETRRRRGACP